MESLVKLARLQVVFGLTHVVGKHHIFLYIGWPPPAWSASNTLVEVSCMINSGLRGGCRKLLHGLLSWHSSPQWEIDILEGENSEISYTISPQLEYNEGLDVLPFELKRDHWEVPHV